MRVCTVIPTNKTNLLKSRVKEINFAHKEVSLMLFPRCKVALGYNNNVRWGIFWGAFLPFFRRFLESRLATLALNELCFTCPCEGYPFGAHDLTLMDVDRSGVVLLLLARFTLFNSINLTPSLDPRLAADATPP